MKTITVFIFIAFGLLVNDIIIAIIGNYEYSKKYESYWSLSVKASSITKKIEGLDRFVEALEKSNLQGQHDALFMDTPDNGFDENFEALKSLQIRLHEISAMDVKSFEYQTALQQLTQQEQNEADAMLKVFEGVWWKENHFLLWSWIGGAQVIFLIVLFITLLIVWSDSPY